MQDDRIYAENERIVTNLWGSEKKVIILLQISQKRLKSIKNVVKYRRSFGENKELHVKNC